MGKVGVNTDVYICNMIVSDASTLILLARVSILRRFLSAFGKIIVPEGTVWKSSDFRQWSVGCTTTQKT